jgi:hypothetical protein
LILTGSSIVISQGFQPAEKSAYTKSLGNFSKGHPLRTQDFSGLAKLYRNVRFGAVLQPDALEAELKPLKERPHPMATHALTAAAPMWLVDRFDPQHSKLAHRAIVYPTVDRRDHLLALLLQCDGIQLRWLMQLSDPAVQKFLLDALQHRALTFLLAIENTRQMAAMGFAFDMEEPQALRDMLATARPSSHGIMPLAQLTTLYSNAEFGPSIVDGEKVTDLLTVMVGTDTKAQLQAAAVAKFEFETASKAGMKSH